MSGKLDQSLDEILSTRRKVNRRSGPRAAKTAKANGATTAPAGGIKKSTKPNRQAVKATPAAPALVQKESKIVVSGLPTDVNEAQIKEYFQKSVGSVKRVIITYNQNGVSRGIAQIYFGRADAAQKAASELNGMLVDKKPMRIEVVLDASAVPTPAPAKSLGDRIAYAPGRKSGQPGPLTKISANPKAQPKAQPKSAAAKPKEATAGTRGKAAGRGRGGRKGRNPGRPKKSAEELDQEMTDYMAGGTGSGDANGTAAPAPAATNGDDLGMDEIS